MHGGRPEPDECDGEGSGTTETASVLQMVEPATDVTGSMASPMSPSWNQVVGFLTDWKGVRALAA